MSWLELIEVESERDQIWLVGASVIPQPMGPDQRQVEMKGNCSSLGTLM